ncbi:MAG: ABC transporter ATP-binding protein [Clostridia bacterium]|nr:ABC transporter ATP-binding protein [Clostridia bacterium]
MAKEKKVQPEPKQIKTISKIGAPATDDYDKTKYVKVKDSAGNEVIKEKGYKGLKKTFKFYRKYIGLFLLIIALSLLGSGVSVLSPIFEGNLVDQFTQFNVKKILELAVWLFTVQVLAQMVYTVWYIVLIKLNRNIKIDIKHELVTSLTSLETQNFDKTNSGVFISRINKDANELASFYNNVVDCLADILSNVGFVIYIGFLNIWVFLFILVYISVIFIIENFRIKAWFKNRKRWKEADEKVVGAYGEIVRGVRDVKVLNLKESVINKAETLQNEAIRISQKFDMTNMWWRRASSFSTSLLDLAFIAFSVMLVVNGLMPLSTMLVVYIYMGRVRGLINYVINVKQHFVDGELAAQRVFEILESTTYPRETFGNVELNNFQGNIKFNKVHFGYSNDEMLFKNMSFDINAGQTVAIVGKSGQGKSTILSLIDKLYKVQKGEITIDGVNVNDLTEKSLRDNISIVMQIPYIFNTTIMENLQFVKPNATKEEIYEACKQAQIHDFIMEQPKQYESMIGENGVVLSGGQRQRLAIARALLKNSKVILFDEATSALDNQSQGKIKKVIDNLKRTHTIVIVAHRLSTVVDCDKIIVIDKNKVIAEGTHKYLMRNCEVYNTLYKTEENSEEEEKKQQA